MADIIYTYHNNVYFNITNRCTCRCVFCIRDEKDTLGEAREMWHDHNPSFEEIKAAVDAFDFSPYAEAVFCGYGEPTCSYDNLIATAKYMREKNPHVSLRYIDAVSISLNAPTSARYQEITRPCYEDAFKDMLAFAEKAKSAFQEVKFSVVSIISEEEIAASQKLADEMGIPLRVRIYS